MGSHLLKNWTGNTTFSLFWFITSFFLSLFFSREKEERKTKEEEKKEQKPYRRILRSLFFSFFFQLPSKRKTKISLSLSFFAFFSLSPFFFLIFRSQFNFPLSFHWIQSLKKIPKKYITFNFNQIDPNLLRMWVMHNVLPYVLVFLLFSAFSSCSNKGRS